MSLLSEALFYYRFHYDGTTSCDILDQAFLRYFDIIFYGHPLKQSNGKPNYRACITQPCKVGADVLPGLTVADTDCSEIYPSLQSNESCKGKTFRLGLFKLFREKMCPSMTK